MDLVLCHTTADFDTLGAAVGVARLRPGSRIVLTGGCHPAVKEFLALRRDQYPLIERRAVRPEQIRSITLVDAQRRDRVGPAATWLDYAIAQGLPIIIYDHHSATDVNTADTDIPGAEWHLAPVGATVTVVVEALQQQQQQLTPPEATVMALGIHVDTGSLTFEQATARDATALAWLMTQGASQAAIAAAKEPGLSSRLQTLLGEALDQIETETFQGYRLGWVKLKTTAFVPGLSSLAERLMSLLPIDALLLGATYSTGRGEPKYTLIGRSRQPPGLGQGIDWSQLLEPLGGGGHPQAAAASGEGALDQALLEQLLAQLRAQIPPLPQARSLMSAPVRTIPPETEIAVAQRLLLRYGHAGLCVVDAGRLVGIVSRRDIELALHHGLGHAPVKGYMATALKTVEPDTPLSTLQDLMVTHDIGRLPVLEADQLVGIVTRTDLLRQVHQTRSPDPDPSRPAAATPPPAALYSRLMAGLPPTVQTILEQIAAAAQQHQWQLYVVGGAVRDLLLAASEQPIAIQDLDLVVDGGADQGAGVELAQSLGQRYPQVELQIHGQFQTAALIWHAGDRAESVAGAAERVMIDIATARTEFYPYPAANPEVESSSIRQDLYRRDFSINAMAIRLTSPQPGELLDFFGGWADLEFRQIRVLHANSLIEDPTRIFRAVRFAVRLGFEIEAQTEQYIRHAVESGIYPRLQTQPGRAPALQTRLKAELQRIFSADSWPVALARLDQLGALRCIHSSLDLQPSLWRQLGRMDRWQARFAADWDSTLPRWLRLLEVLLADLAPELRDCVAATLTLPDRSQARLAQLATAEAAMVQPLPGSDWSSLKPSQIYQRLSHYEPDLLLLVGVRYPRSVGPVIWRYLVQLRPVKPPLNGADLKQMGYRPGPIFREILTALTAAQLDGAIASPAAAQAYVRERFQRDKRSHAEGYRD
ncbi:CBS domain-containing protein [Romeria aff. gracilis LEGE 07310]|uniref:CBS domain-containing protein n=1 Tax=Vasconcelosia minhoensis LEGE 07310 TaxID=915328 RepID=A0A8J7DBA9_9CYAN|nr:CBS domain-containing protein [Romeria gracilis]MBE9076133.1 CBS domain-containing protein [Romeria aff. gracilis LEGE 07310]